MAKAKKKAAKKAVKKKPAKKVVKKSKEMLLVASKTKDALKGKGYNVSSDALEAMNDYVYFLVEQAQKKCTANGRKTIRPYDILA
jgi:histone H3/H4